MDRQDNACHQGTRERRRAEEQEAPGSLSTQALARAGPTSRRQARTRTAQGLEAAHTEGGRHLSGRREAGTGLGGNTLVQAQNHSCTCH